MEPDPYSWALPFEVFALVPVLALAWGLAFGRFGASRAGIAACALALALVAVAFVTPVQPLALHYLLSAHLLQNVVLAEWAPLLLVFALPPAAAAAVGSAPIVSTLVRPLVALPLWLGTYFVWHVPAIYDAALRRPHTLLHLEHVCYLLTGLALWWPVAQGVPRRLTNGAKALYVFAAFVLASPLGLLLALLPKPLYDFYEQAPRRIWGLTALSDQQLAGLTMASEQAVVFFAVFAIFFLRFLREEEAAGVQYRDRVPGRP
jgi:cytochrome c oxidase assembly factor CtaG